MASEPVILSIPSITERFYMVQLLDFWTNTFGEPGSRTTGTAAQSFAICGPGFSGTLPDGVKPYTSPTNDVWMLIRYEILKDEPLDKLWSVQDAAKLTLLSQWSSGITRPVVKDHKPVTN